jgi:chemotaxis protein CheY-P-specific phosphatase CheC
VAELSVEEKGMVDTFRFTLEIYGSIALVASGANASNLIHKLNMNDKNKEPEFNLPKKVVMF